MMVTVILAVSVATTVAAEKRNWAEVVFAKGGGKVPRPYDLRTGRYVSWDEAKKGLGHVILPSGVNPRWLTIRIAAQSVLFSNSKHNDAKVIKKASRSASWNAVRFGEVYQARFGDSVYTIRLVRSSYKNFDTPYSSTIAYFPAPRDAQRTDTLSQKPISPKPAPKKATIRVLDIDEMFASQQRLEQLAFYKAYDLTRKQYTNWYLVVGRLEKVRMPPGFWMYILVGTRGGIAIHQGNTARYVWPEIDQYVGKRMIACGIPILLSSRQFTSGCAPLLKKGYALKWQDNIGLGRGKMFVQLLPCMLHGLKTKYGCTKSSKFDQKVQERFSKLAKIRYGDVIKRTQKVLSTGLSKRLGQSSSTLDRFMDASLAASGIDPNSEDARLAKRFSKAWLNPMASEKEIHGMLEELSKQFSGEK